MRYLPSTQINSLRVVVIALILGCTFQFLGSLRLMLQGYAFYGVLAVGLWAPLAVGLWRLHPVARNVAVGMLWFFVIAIPLGTLNPFAAMNDYGPNPPSVWELAAKVYAGVAVAVFALHILGKYKSEFGQRSETAT